MFCGFRLWMTLEKSVSQYESYSNLLCRMSITIIQHHSYVWLEKVYILKDIKLYKLDFVGIGNMLTLERDPWYITQQHTNKIALNHKLC